ncbi:E3 UFM1-protein ligase 1 [Clarias gariepinus]|uniref:E3 UFM1-protein ligase 1 n=1 Tax=Clarias gariepinus TaxID=13013 RepID=UPI00234DB68F|nr:E3 UFM1-protein ligase 1 [Clarias gariepinus]
MADWEEIRRLAADFQRVQFTESVQRLSERNCIEIITKLVEEKKLDVVHTLDGKEFITPSQISREIRDELYTHGGRINVVDLQKIINVDLVHVESRANEVARSEKGTRIILGQLITEHYLEQMCEEVNDKLQEAGQVNITELSKTHQLPADFLTQELSARLGRLVDGHMDQFNGLIFTQNFINRQKAKIRGLFSSITRPTLVNNLINQYGLQDNLLYSLLEELVNSGRVLGSVVGGRQDKAVFVPDVYCRAQNAWVESFLTHNSYLEFESLSRLGIPDPVSYIKKRFKDRKLLFLQSVCVDAAILDQLEASVEEAINSETWIDLQLLLPSCLSLDDSATLISHVIHSVRAQSSARVLGTAVVSEKFISSCLALFDDIMQQKAQAEVKSDPVLLITEDDMKMAPTLAENSSSKRDKREERRKKASEGSGSVRAGGGGNAREVRIRKTKKKNKREEESDDETAAAQSKPTEPVFLSVQKIVEVLEKRVCDCPMETLELLAQELVRPLSRVYQEVVRSVLLSSTSTSPSAGKRRHTAKELQEEINTLYANVRALEKGTKYFSDDDQLHMAKHILKSVCSDLTNAIIAFLSDDQRNFLDSSSSITPEVRTKILAKLPDEIKTPLMKLNTSLNGKSIEEFLCSVEAAAEECGILLKKGDKKKEKLVLSVHKQSLMEQLEAASDEALVLHLTVLLLFQQHTHCMLLAPGRCVSSIIYTLHSKLPQDHYELLMQYHTLVVKRLVKKKAEQMDVENEGLAEELKEPTDLTMDIKKLVFSPRKTSTSEQ